MDTESIVRLSLFVNILEKLFLDLERQDGIVYIDKECHEELYGNCLSNIEFAGPGVQSTRPGFTVLKYSLRYDSVYQVELNERCYINRATAQSKDKAI